MKKLPKFAERRRHNRHNIIENELITVELGPGQQGVLIDVSEGGMAVQPFVPLTQGAPSDIEFRVPGENSPIHATGIVAWIGESGRTGIKFTDVPSPSMAELNRWLKKHEQIPQAAAAIDDEHEISPDPAEAHVTLAEMADRVREIVSGDGAAIAIDFGTQLICVATSGTMVPDVGVAIAPGVGLAGQCVQTAHVVVCRDAQHDERVNPIAAQQLNLGASIAVPIIHLATVKGVLQVCWSTTRDFTGGEVHILTTLAQQIAKQL